jgi:hypothetical protein
MLPDWEREAARICEAALDRPASEREAFVVEAVASATGVARALPILDEETDHERIAVIRLADRRAISAVPASS